MAPETVLATAVVAAGVAVAACRVWHARARRMAARRSAAGAARHSRFDEELRWVRMRQQLTSWRVSRDHRDRAVEDAMV